MAIVWGPRDEHLAWATDGLQPGEVECFYCGNSLSYPFVYWQSGRSIVLHPMCVAGLFMALSHDAIRCKHGRAWRPK